MGTAGTAILDSPHIIQHYDGTDIPAPDLVGRVQVRRYHPRSPRYQSFQVVNAYLHSGLKYTDNTPILKALLNVSNEVPTFLVGDWNFVERPEDTTSANYKTPPSYFLNLFRQVLEHFGSAELPHDHHTFFKLSEESLPRSSRLDRIYIPNSVLNNPLFPPIASIFHHSSNVQVKRKATRTWFSDHLPIMISYPRTDENDHRPTISRWVASSPEFLVALKSAWNDYPISHPYRALKGYKRALFRAARITKERQLENASIMLRLSHHLSLLRLIQQPKQDNDKITQLLNQHPQLNSMVKCDQVWTDAGLSDAINNMLVPSESTVPTKHNIINEISSIAPHTRARISALKEHIDDPPTEDRAEMGHIATRFWSKIWSKRDPDARRSDARNFFLHPYNKHVNQDLISLPDMDFIQETIANSKNSCAGPDGISFAAWRAWPEASSRVLAAVLKVMCSGRDPPPEFNHGLLFLLPKKHTGLVSDTRPLSVTNTDNRILASAVARSCLPAIKDLVHPCQKGFLNGIDGTEHLVDINNFFYSNLAKRINSHVFLLDTAKAFDSIDHDWIHEVLQRAAFPTWFKRFVRCSLTDVKVSPFFGDTPTSSMDITRGVKQGCPLSPLLFILAYDPLISSLTTIPEISPHAYADDLAITTHNIENLHPALCMVDKFSIASGLGVNRDKSCIISTARPHIVQNFIDTSEWPDLQLRDKATHSYWQEGYARRNLELTTREGPSTSAHLQAIPSQSLHEQPHHLCKRLHRLPLLLSFPLLYSSH